MYFLHMFLHQRYVLNNLTNNIDKSEAKLPNLYLATWTVYLVYWENTGLNHGGISFRIVIRDSDFFCNVIQLNLKLDRNTLCLTGLYLIGHAHSSFSNCFQRVSISRYWRLVCLFVFVCLKQGIEKKALLNALFTCFACWLSVAEAQWTD